MDNLKRISFCCYIMLSLCSCAMTAKTNQHRDYIYNKQIPNVAGHGIILSRVYDNRNKSVAHGKHYMSAQLLLLGPKNKKYYLGDYYSSDFAAEDRHYRKMMAGSKSDFQVYDGMAAYSLLYLPEGEYYVIASAYYNKDYTNVKGYRYSNKAVKRFFIAPGEIVYIGDIAASSNNYLVIDEFAQAKEFISYAYPKLLPRLTFKPLR